MKRCAPAFALVLVVASASAQDAGTLVLENRAGHSTLSARGGVRRQRWCGGIRPSHCDEASVTLRVAANGGTGAVRGVRITLHAPGPRPTRARVVSTPGPRQGVRAEDPECAYAEVEIETAGGRVSASGGSVTLTRWDETSAEGSFRAIASDAGAPRSIEGRFSIRYARPEEPPPCGGEPLP